MPIAQLKRIAFQFPRKQPVTRPFFKQLVSLLEHDPSSQNLMDKLVLFPPYPNGALPVMTLELEDINYPAVMFDMTERVVVKAGAFAVHSSLDAIRTATLPLTMDPGKRPPIFPLAKFVQLLKGHILRLDHAGVELPSEAVQKEKFDGLVQAVGKVANLYRYPTGEEWPYLLPASYGEFRSEIREFARPRSPKLELTYGYVQVPLIHFQVDTDLPREYIEAYFPSQYGTNLPGVTSYRSLYIEQPWPGLLMRFDLVYFTGNQSNTWDSGEWLVKQGMRVGRDAP
jgi:hypothetical protein